MAKTPKPKNEDEEQSRRFIDAAKAMQDAGELSPTEDGAAFDRLLGKALQPRKRTAPR